MSQSVQESSFTRLPGRMNEEVLLRMYQVQYVLIHVPERIYHVVIFCITQPRGIKKSFHFVNILLLGVGCAIKLRRWLGTMRAASDF